MIWGGFREGLGRGLGGFWKPLGAFWALFWDPLGAFWALWEPLNGVLRVFHCFCIVLLFFSCFSLLILSWLHLFVDFARGFLCFPLHNALACLCISCFPWRTLAFPCCLLLPFAFPYLLLFACHGGERSELCWTCYPYISLPCPWFPLLLPTFPRYPVLSLALLPCSLGISLLIGFPGVPSLSLAFPCFPFPALAFSSFTLCWRLKKRSRFPFLTKTGFLVPQACPKDQRSL